MNARTITAILAVMAILLMFSVLRGTADLAEGPETVSYTAFKALVRDGRVIAVIDLDAALGRGDHREQISELC